MTINSKIDPKELNKEKDTILEEMKMHNDDPRSFAAKKFQELLYEGTPLGYDIIGTEKTINSMDRKKILAFKENFYNPDNIVIAIGGNIHQAKVKKLLEKYFGKLKGKTKDSFARVIPKKDKAKIRFHKKDIQQSSIIMGFHSFERGHKDRYIRSLIACVLGGYMSSKLFVEIREKKGLAYYIGTFTEAYKETGCFGIYGGFSPKKLEEALQNILKILHDVKKNGFKPSEIKMAKENSIGKLVLNLESSGSWAAGIAESILQGIPFETPDQMIKFIKKITNSDIKRVAKEMFQEKNFNMVVVGPTDPKEEKKFLKLIKL